MMDIQKTNIFDFETLVETNDVEMKKAAGRDGKGAIPDSLWETYSAMANTEGGIIILGAEQISDREFKPFHLANAEKMVQNFWNILNDPKKVSKNILHENDVRIVHLPSGEKIISITIPQTTRFDKPVFINNQLFGGTYKRYNEGDYRCPDDVVKQMLAEQVSETMDDTIMAGYGFDDIDMPTFNAYRNRFSNNKPDHPFLSMPPEEFLRQIGGYRIDRNSGQAGLTLAGLLMFGKLRDILDNVPNYILDYQERPRAVTELRWIDRVTTDFTWAGNLFSFYQIVIKKLFADLKIPFQLKNATIRIDDTPVHKAIREALINTLIHADYRGRCSVLVVKRPDLFGFRNPGTFRIPKIEVLRGGSSDCRNRNLQKMFQLIGLSEQAGSGIPKIYYGWDSQDWKRPEYEERFDTNQTILALRMSSLLPEETVEDVQKTIGIGKYRALSKLERLAVVTAFAEGCVNRERLLTLTREHVTDISSVLKKLLQKNILSMQGHGKSTIYFPLGHPPVRDDIQYCTPFTLKTSLSNNGTRLPRNDPSSSSHNGVKLPHNGSQSSPHNGESSPHNGSQGSPHNGSQSSPHNDESSPRNSSQSSPHDSMKASTIDDLIALNSLARNEIVKDEELLAIAAPVRTRKRVFTALLEKVIMDLCKERFLSMIEISVLLKRDEKTIRNYLARLCRDGFLTRRYPTINDPRQQYTTILEKVNK